MKDPTPLYNFNKLIMPIIQRRVGIHQRGQSEEQTTQWSKGQNVLIKTR
jgi:hypothetical protein